MELTSEQKDAVLSIDGNIVAMASAGSGKTKAFTTRIAHMIKNEKVHPSSILAVTFTKKATEEMKKRLSKLVGKDLAHKVAMGTFHSLAYRLLKVLDSDFEKYKIAPDWWKFSLLNDICKVYDEDKNPHGMGLGVKAGELASFISYQKNNMVHTHEPVIMDDYTNFIVGGLSRDMLQGAYAQFERLKEASRMIDFDDMLLMMYDNLKTNEQFREKLQNQYKYIMVDEGQDTSLINMEIIKMINNKNVYLVGDFRQSIYSFINARVDNILDFHKEFEDVKVIELNKNFRSTQNIVEFSNAIIDNSPIDKYKEFKHSESVAEVGEPIELTMYRDEDSQFDDIIKKINEIHSEGTPLKEIAILVRTNSQTAIIEEKLADMDMPYEVSKSMSFFDRKEVLDLLSYARIAVDQDDDVSLRRVINTPNRYLGKRFVEELEKFASERDMTLLTALKKSPHYGEWKFKRNIDSLIDSIYEFKSQADTGVNAGRFFRNAIRKLQYKKFIEDNSMNASMIPEKLASIERLCEMASRFPTVRAFLAHVMSIKEKQAKSKGVDAVQISTIHSSKGLEWDVVFVPNINNELMPHTMNNNIEEERRLFYVACSRPRKLLSPSWYLYDGESSIVKEGQFVTEMLGKEKIEMMKKRIFRGGRLAIDEYNSK